MGTPSLSRTEARSRKAASRESGYTVIAFLIVGLIVALLSSRPIQLPDTPTYFHLPGLGSAVSLTGHSRRPWVVTLPYALLRNYSLIVIVQVAFSLISWSVLIWALDFLPLHGAIARWIARGIVVCIALSPLVLVFNPWIQSDSIAMSGAALVMAGFLVFLARPVPGSCLLLLGTLITSQIRIAAAIPTLSIAGILIAVSLYRTRRRQPHKVSDFVPGLAVGVLLIAIVGYNYAINIQMDEYWGSTNSGGSGVLGRTMQQIGVINMTSVGHQAIRDILRSQGDSCLLKLFPANGPTPYWATSDILKCHVESQRFSHEFLSKYEAWLLRHPQEATSELVPPFDQSFSAPPDAGQTPTNLVPAFLASLWTADESQSNPVLLLYLLLLSGVGWLLIFRRTVVSLTLELLFIGSSGLLGVISTVVLSPSDEARVASAPAMIARLSIILGLVMVADRISRLRKDRPSTRQLPAHRRR